jgi:hypothetical protein
MNRHSYPPSQTAKSCRQLARRWSYRPGLIVLEDRVMLSATSTVFTLDQNNSSLTLSGTIGSSSLQQQGTGSLITRYTGSIVAQWDLTAHTINFVQSGTAATALTSGTWQPAVGGGSGSALADYGGRVTIIFITAYAAVRDLVATISTSSPLPLSGGGPSYTFPSTQTLTITQGNADYNAGSFGSGRTSLADNSATNQAAAGAFADLGNGGYRLTVPVNITITKTIAGMTATLHIIGTVVANASIPLVDLSSGGQFNYATQVVATQGPVHITDPAARVTDAGATNLTSMTATLTNRPDGAQESLAADVSGTNLQASYNSATGIESITGTATPAVYQQVLRTLTYRDDSNTPDTHDRIILVSASDAVNSGIVRTSTVSVSAPAISYTVAGFPSPITAGVPGSVTVTARDFAGNVATGYTGTVHFSSSDTQAGLPSNYTFVAADHGAHTFSATLQTAATESITATDTATSSITGTQSGIVVNPAAADHYLVTTSAANPDVAGTFFDVTVTVQDQYNNTVTGYTGTAHFTSADPYGATLPPDHAFQSSDQGSVTFFGGGALYTAGNWDVTATDTVSGITGTTTVSVIAAPAVAFQVIAPSSSVSGSAFDVTLIAVDPYNNTDTNYAGTATWTSSDTDPNVVLPADHAFQPTDQGMVLFSGGVTLITLGNQTISATDTVSGITGSATVNVTSTASVGHRPRPDGATALALAARPVATPITVVTQSETKLPARPVADQSGVALAIAAVAQPAVHATVGHNLDSLFAAFPAQLLADADFVDAALAGTA